MYSTVFIARRHHHASLLVAPESKLSITVLRNRKGVHTARTVLYVWYSTVHVV